MGEVGWKILSEVWLQSENKPWARIMKGRKLMMDSLRV